MKEHCKELDMLQIFATDDTRLDERKNMAKFEARILRYIRRSPQSH